MRKVSPRRPSQPCARVLAAASATSGSPDATSWCSNQQWGARSAAETPKNHQTWGRARIAALTPGPPWFRCSLAGKLARRWAGRWASTWPTKTIRRVRGFRGDTGLGPGHAPRGCSGGAQSRSFADRRLNWTVRAPELGVVLWWDTEQRGWWQALYGADHARTGVSLSPRGPVTRCRGRGADGGEGARSARSRPRSSTGTDPGGTSTTSRSPPSSGSTSSIRSDRTSLSTA